jgi:hypothetical protein
MGTTIPARGRAKRVAKATEAERFWLYRISRGSSDMYCSKMNNTSVSVRFLNNDEVMKWIEP